MQVQVFNLSIKSRHVTHDKIFQLPNQSKTWSQKQ
jgi:hypothetical protein